MQAASAASAAEESAIAAARHAGDANTANARAAALSAAQSYNLVRPNLSLCRSLPPEHPGFRSTCNPVTSIKPLNGPTSCLPALLSRYL